MSWGWLLPMVVSLAVAPLAHRSGLPADRAVLSGVVAAILSGVVLGWWHLRAIRAAGAEICPIARRRTWTSLTWQLLSASFWSAYAAWSYVDARNSDANILNVIQVQCFALAAIWAVINTTQRTRLHECGVFAVDGFVPWDSFASATVLPSHINAQGVAHDQVTLHRRQPGFWRPDVKVTMPVSERVALVSVLRREGIGMQQAVGVDASRSADLGAV